MFSNKTVCFNLLFKKYIRILILCSLINKYKDHYQNFIIDQAYNFK